MEYLVATILIMLFCITALSQDRTSESAIIISREKPKPLKPGKQPERRIIKHNWAQSPAGLSNFAGLPGLELIPVTGGRSVNLYLPAWYVVAQLLLSPRHNQFQPLNTAGRSAKTDKYMVVLSLFKRVDLFAKAHCFVMKKLQFS